MEDMLTPLIAAVVSAIVSYLTARVATYSNNVIAERKAWRNTIRDLSIEVLDSAQQGRTNTAEFEALIAKFRIRLNPDSCYDNEILRALVAISGGYQEPYLEKFLEMVARLLKHDWERAKSESQPLSWLGRPNEDALRLLKTREYSCRGSRVS